MRYKHPSTILLYYWSAPRAGQGDCAGTSLRKKLCVKPGKKVDLSKWDPNDTDGVTSKTDAEPILGRNVQRLGELQYLLYAENQRALLVVLQAMDADGKDGTIRHVMSAVNPQSCRVTAFKQPSPKELAHDFLWRIHHNVPRRGEIGIFNRSHYEDVWSRRYGQINTEDHLTGQCGSHRTPDVVAVRLDVEARRH